jgi:hypothetical protein
MASGKSRALMFIALDKLHNQKLKQAIIIVPEKTIGASFHGWKIFRPLHAEDRRENVAEKTETQREKGGRVSALILYTTEGQADSASPRVDDNSVWLTQLEIATKAPTGRRLIARGVSPWFNEPGAKSPKGATVRGTLLSPRWGSIRGVRRVQSPGAHAPGY